VQLAFVNNNRTRMHQCTFGVHLLVIIRFMDASSCSLQQGRIESDLSAQTSKTIAHGPKDVLPVAAGEKVGTVVGGGQKRLYFDFYFYLMPCRVILHNNSQKNKATH